MQRRQLQVHREQAQLWSLQKYKEKAKPISQANKHKTKKHTQLGREEKSGKEELVDPSIKGKGGERHGCYQTPIQVPEAE